MEGIDVRFFRNFRFAIVGFSIWLRVVSRKPLTEAESQDCWWKLAWTSLRNILYSLR